MILSLENVSYKYANKRENCLNNISFKVDKGETIAIVGKSGSGKSTLGYILSGIIPNHINDGHLVGHLNCFSTSENKVGLVTQTPENQLFGFRVEDAIVFGLENMGLKKEEIEERLFYVLNLLGIEKLRNRAVNTLSGGQKQSVCIASVLALQPDILVMDEPTSSLDPAGKLNIQNILNRLNKAGLTIILIDQNIDWSSQVIDRIIGLYETEVVYNGDKKSFFQDPVLYKKLGVSVPQVIEMYHTFRNFGQDLPFITTVEEAIDALKKYKIVDHPNVSLLENEADRNTSNSNENIISVQELTHEFDDFKALDKANANFARGKVTTILGQNGSGKSTFVRHLNRLLKPTSGKVFFKNESTENRSVAEMANHVALVFQHPDHMIFEDTVTKEITFSSRTLNNHINEKQLEDILEKYSFSDYAEAFPMNLSMGQKHMLTIMSVLMTECDVIILDEPTLGMDRDFKKLLLCLIKELKEHEKTIILISHELSFVAECTDEITLMQSGKIVRQGKIEDLFQQSGLFHQLSIPLPQVTELANALGLGEHFHNVDEFVEKLLEVESSITGGK